MNQIKPIFSEGESTTLNTIHHKAGFSLVSQNANWPYKSMLNMESFGVTNLIMQKHFKHKSVLLFWYLDNFLEKDKTGLPLQINIALTVFTGLIS